MPAWQHSSSRAGHSARAYPGHRLGTPHRGTRLAEQEEQCAERLHPLPPSFIPSTSPTASLGMSEVSSAQEHAAQKGKVTQSVIGVSYAHTCTYTARTRAGHRSEGSSETAPLGTDDVSVLLSDHAVPLLASSISRGKLLGRKLL